MGIEGLKINEDKESFEVKPLELLPDDEVRVLSDEIKWIKNYIFWLERPEVEEDINQLKQCENQMQKRWFDFDYEAIFKDYEFFFKEEVLVTSWALKIAIEKWEEKINEAKERFEKNSKQIELLVEFWNAYINYLQNLSDHVTIPLLSNKDEQYDLFSERITTELVNLKSLNQSWITDFNIDSIFDKIFVSEAWISQNMSGHSHMAFNIISEHIKSVLKNDNLTQNEKRFEFYEKIRAYDRADNSPLLVNSVDSVKTGLMPQILDNEKLNKNTEIKAVFDKIKNLDNDQLIKISNSLTSWRDNFEKNILQILWLEEEHKEIIDDLYDKLHEIIWEKVTQALLDSFDKKLKDSIKWLPEDQRKEVEKSFTPEVIDELKGKMLLETISKFSKDIVKDAMLFSVLDKNSDFVYSLWDKEIDFYSSVIWVWNKISDETMNDIISRVSHFWAQLAIMVVAWQASVLAWTITGASSLTGVSWYLASTFVEWTAFYWAYTLTDWLTSKNSISEVMESFSVEWYARTVAFLWVLKAVSMPIAKGMDKVSLPWIVEKPLLITLDTWMLIWTDIVVRYSFWEWVPTWNRKDFENFLISEVEEILPLVIWLRITETWINKVKNPINVTVNERWDIIIDGLKKDLRILKQSLNVAKRKWNKAQAKEIAENIWATRKEIKVVKQINQEPMWEKGLWLWSDASSKWSTQRENANYTVERTKKASDLSSEKLDAVLTWFKGSKELSDWFNALLKDFAKIKNYAKIEEKVRKQIAKEIDNNVVYIERLWPEDMKIVERTKDRLTKDFMDALKQAKDLKRGKRERLEERFWNVEFVTKIMGRFNDAINNRSKDVRSEIRSDIS